MHFGRERVHVGENANDPGDRVPDVLVKVKFISDAFQMLLADLFHRRVEFRSFVLPVFDVPDPGDGVEDSRVRHDDRVYAAGELRAARYLGELVHAVLGFEVRLAENDDDAFASADAVHELLDRIPVADFGLVAGDEHSPLAHPALDLIDERLAISAPAVGDEDFRLDRFGSRGRARPVCGQHSWPAIRHVRRKQPEQLDRIAEPTAPAALDLVARLSEVFELADLEHARLTRHRAGLAVARHEFLEPDTWVGTVDDAKLVVDETKQHARIATPDPDGENPAAIRLDDLGLAALVGKYRAAPPHQVTGSDLIVQGHDEAPDDALRHHVVLVPQA
jgi:hypothetical protein